MGRRGGRKGFKPKKRGVVLPVAKSDPLARRRAALAVKEGEKK